VLRSVWVFSNNPTVTKKVVSLLLGFRALPLNGTGSVPA
jgi:hypothetical protein